MNDEVIYNGRLYKVQTSGRYYYGSGTPRLLHRKVWTDHYGEIPKGYVIHHKDHNWRNNDISNLEMVERGKHYRDHALEKYTDPIYKEKNRKQLKSAQEKAKLWHASLNGLEWHSKNSKEAWKNRKFHKIICKECAKEHLTPFPSRTKYCSNTCSQKRQHGRYITDKRVCVECSKEFMAHRHRKVECCGYSCAAQRKARLRKDKLMHANI